MIRKLNKYLNNNNINHYYIIKLRKYVIFGIIESKTLYDLIDFCTENNFNLNYTTRNQIEINKNGKK